MSEGVALSLNGLSKSFGSLKAVDGLTFDVRRGEVFGFLGPNGAGKSTAIKMLLGLVTPDAGSFEVLGHDLAREPHAVKRRLGYLPERVAFYPNLTALQTLEFYARLKGVKDTDLRGLIDSVGLTEFADARLSTFSKGMTQLVGVAQALLGSPELLILDEPTSGLDPNWARRVKDRVLEAKRRGATVFFSSHILSEVQELADRVAILARGKLVALDSVATLGATTSRKPELWVTLGPQSEHAFDVARAVPGVESVRSENGELVAVCLAEAKTAVISALFAAGVVVRDFKTVDPSLEDIFLNLTDAKRGQVR